MKNFLQVAPKRNNRRWRKKHHTGEYTEHGFNALFHSNEATLEEFFEFLSDNEMHAGGGCCDDERNYTKNDLYVSSCDDWAIGRPTKPRGDTCPKGHPDYRKPVRSAEDSKMAMEARRKMVQDWLLGNSGVTDVVMGELIDMWNGPSLWG